MLWRIFFSVRDNFSFFHTVSLIQCLNFKIFTKEMWDKNLWNSTLCHAQYIQQREKTRNSLSLKKYSSNQLFSNFLSLVNPLLSRNFCEKSVRDDICNFHSHAVPHGDTLANKGKIREINWFYENNGEIWFHEIMYIKYSVNSCLFILHEQCLLHTSFDKNIVKPPFC